MPHSRMRFWLMALAVALAFDLFFWNKAPGISFFLWVLLILAGGWWLARMDGVRPARATWVLGAAVLGFAAVPMLRSEEFTALAGAGLALTGTLLIAATFRDGYWTHYRLRDYLLALGGLIVAGLSRLLSGLKLSPPAGETAAATPPRAGLRKALPVLRGLLLALPVVLVLGALLASADPIFEQRLGGLLNLFTIERLPEYLFRLVYILVFSYIFAGLYLHAVHPLHTAARPDPDAPSKGEPLGWIEALVVLVSVNLLFAFFVAIQFVYLFGGQANITTEGFTYAEYARRGFYELLAVAVISLALYSSLTALTRPREGRAQTAFRALCVLLLALVTVILVSSFQRLTLYESAYGFSRLRTYTHVFILWLGIALLAAVVLELLGRRGRLALALLGALVGFGASLAAINVDGFIVRQNVARAAQGQELDSAYLASLSDDAVPVLVELYATPDLPQSVHDSLGLELSCRSYRMKNEEPQPWVSFRVSHAAARQLLEANDADLAARYPLELSPEGEPLCPAYSPVDD